MTKRISEIDRTNNFLRACGTYIKPGFRFTTRGGYRMVVLESPSEFGNFKAANTDLDGFETMVHWGMIPQNDTDGYPLFGEWH